MKTKSRSLIGARALSFVSAVLLACALGAPAFADDGEQTLKRMTGGSIDNQLTVLPEDVGLHVSEASTPSPI